MPRESNQRDHRLTSLLLAYKNEADDYIAEQIAPRVPSNDMGQYQSVSPGTFFQKKRTKIPYGGHADELTTSSKLHNYSLEDYGIDAPVDLSENRAFVMNRQTGAVDEDHVHTLLYQAMIAAEETICLEYEEEVRDVAFAPSSYADHLRIALGDGDKFNAATSNPIEVVRDALVLPVGMPTVGVCGPKVFNALAANANINRAAHGNDGSAGFQSVDTVARVLGLDRLVVGHAWAGVEKVDDKPSDRIWDTQDSLALIRVKRPMSLTTHNGGAFMVTASSREGRFTRKWFDNARGALGSEICRPVDQRKVLHLSSISGALITGCLAT